MILENAKPRLNDAIELANQSKKEQEVTFIYNELLTHDTVTAVFDWLFRQSVDFKTRHDEYRFVIIVYPKHNYQ